MIVSNHPDPATEFGIKTTDQHGASTLQRIERAARHSRDASIYDDQITRGQGRLHRIACIADEAKGRKVPGNDALQPVAANPQAVFMMIIPGHDDLTGRGGLDRCRPGR